MQSLTVFDPATRYPAVASELTEILAPERLEIAFAYCTRRALNLLIDRELLRWRNPRYTFFGTIDVEIDHPLAGWIPFTADPTDVELHGRRIFWALHKQGVARRFTGEIPEIAYMAYPNIPRPVKKLSRRELFFGRGT